MRDYIIAHTGRIGRALAQDKRGVTALEYGLIAAVIIVVCAAGFAMVGGDLKNTLTNVSNCLGATTPSATTC